MVESETHLCEVQVEVALGHVAKGIGPVLGIAPESLDAVNVISADRAALFLADHHMVAPEMPDCVVSDLGLEYPHAIAATLFGQLAGFGQVPRLVDDGCAKTGGLHDLHAVLR